ncbi:uncharacterized protein EI97DRAFT_441057 [Westerdykella ornata]|uniref:Uncharacterized protein n=1 Tax=Westerdykella ornata TaxID=318751 RepID=A0A6A6JNN9_WESOR|nr:uncharacterized protein EI97DRAFT_441057 [Westerdykella ornata]KAF2277753.1 hypothetical protein EI97DRAFT_441057 [Westerdykella ornata]
MDQIGTSVKTYTRPCSMVDRSLPERFPDASRFQDLQKQSNVLKGIGWVAKVQIIRHARVRQAHFGICDHPQPKSNSLGFFECSENLSQELFGLLGNFEHGILTTVDRNGLDVLLETLCPKTSKEDAKAGSSGESFGNFKPKAESKAISGTANPKASREASRKAKRSFNVKYLQIARIISTGRSSKDFGSVILSGHMLVKPVGRYFRGR